MKRVLLISGGVFIFLLILLFVSSFGKKTTVQEGLPTPTPVQVRMQEHQGSVPVSSFSPQPGSTVPNNEKIVISLDKSVNPSLVNFKIYPDIPYSLSIQGNNLVVVPNQPFESGTTYTYSLQYTQQEAITGTQNTPTTASFTVEGPTPVLSPDTFPSGAYNDNQQYLKDNYPDSFLRNLTPYSSSTFSIKSFYKNGSPGHFAFSVSLIGTDKNASKGDFLNWLRAQGLSDAQIQTLDISYL